MAHDQPLAGAVGVRGTIETCSDRFIDQRLVAGGAEITLTQHDCDTYPTISIHDDTSDTLAFFHQVKCLVDPFQRQDMSDHRIDLNESIHVPIDDARRIGATARPAKCRAPPYAPRHKLERSRSNLGSRRRDADDHALSPTAMAGFQSLAHDHHVSRAVEGVVRTAAGQLDEVRHDIGGDFIRIDEMRHAEAAAPPFLLIVDVDADDHLRPDELQALDDVETDAAETEYRRVRAGLNLGSVDHRSHACRHAATAITRLVKWRVGANLCDCDLRQNREVRECRAAHIVKNRLAAI